MSRQSRLPVGEVKPLKSSMDILSPTADLADSWQSTEERRAPCTELKVNSTLQETSLSRSCELPSFDDDVNTDENNTENQEAKHLVRHFGSRLYLN